MKTYIDLHIHSTASDGTLSPSEIVKSAIHMINKEKNSPIALAEGTENTPGICKTQRNPNQAVIALTDHDTTAGLEEFLREAEKYKDQITAIPGIEISSDYHGTEIHILGYQIDPAQKTFQNELKKYRESRDGRNKAIIQKLQKRGFHISMEELRADHPDETIARPHIARKLMEKHYVSSVKEAFDQYLAEGRSCYVPRIKPDVQKAIRLILENGGIPVLAHLMYDRNLSSAQKNELTAALKEEGLAGIEAYYNTYTPAEEAYVLGLARQHGLIVTGGSDFHGENKPHISLFTGQGNMSVPKTILPDFLAAVKKNTGPLLS